MDEEIQKRFEKIEIRLASLEKHLPFIPKSSSKRQFKEQLNTITNNKKSLPDYIIELRDSGFFSKPQIPEEAHQKLQSVYACDFDRTRIALLRLANNKKLRKTTKIVDGQARKAYVW